MTDRLPVFSLQSAVFPVDFLPMLTLPRPGKMQPFGRVNTAGLEERAAWLTKRSIKKESKLWALRTAVSMCDLTTLEGADTEEKVRSLIAKALRPYSAAYGMPSEEEVACPPVAAICVYPNLVPFAAQMLRKTEDRGLQTADKNPGLQSAVSSLQSNWPLPKIASVATAFPSGQSPLSTRLAEVKWAIKNGADEIDMVINRNAFLAGDYKTVHKEIEKAKQAMLEASKTVDRRLETAEKSPGLQSAVSSLQSPPHLKVILETGELGSYDAVRNASFIAMHAGADFIKTSTGKIGVAATLPVTLCMLEAIRDFYDQTGMRIGMKPAGGIRTAKQAIHYLVVVNETLGEEWLTPDLFRFGASSLLNDLLAQMVKQLTGAYRSAEEFSEV